MLALLSIFLIVFIEITTSKSKIEIEKENTECYNNCNLNYKNLINITLNNINIYEQKNFEKFLVGAKEAKLKKRA